MTKPPSSAKSPVVDGSASGQDARDFASAEMLSPDKQIDAQADRLLPDIDIGVLVVGRDLTIRRFTPAAAEVLHLVAGDIGRPLAVVDSRADAIGLGAIVSGVLESSEPHVRELRTPSGSTFAVRVDPYHTADGRIDGVVVLVVDLTAIHRGEEAQVHLAAIVESSEDSIVSKTLEGVITSWNKGAERLYGYTAAEMIGQPISILIPAGRPDELPGILRRLARGERIEQYETVRRRKDGTLLDVSVSISPIRDVRKRIIGAAAITRDISARKAAESLLRFQVEASVVLSSLDTKDAILQKVASLVVPFLADGCLVDAVDRDGRVRRAAISHEDPKRLAILKELDDRYPRTTMTERGPANVIRTGEPELQAEISDSFLARFARDAEHLALLRALSVRSYLSVPLHVRDAVVGAITFLTTDARRRFTMNDVRIAEDLAFRAGIALENARLYGELREADRSKDEFLAILAHELRNPLAPIRSAVEVMRLKNPQDRELETVRDIIDRQTRQMTRIVDDLLDISRISHGRIELRRKHVTIDSIFESAVESSRPLIEARGHELVVSVPDEPLWLDVDSTRLAQVFLNLLNNAAKFTPPGGTIWLTAAREKGEESQTGEEHAIITVRDTGIGIPEEMRERIFELFAQGDRSLERSQGGLGVGLTLVRSLLQLHGGAIEARSAGTGKGTEFVVRLPLSTRT